MLLRRSLAHGSGGPALNAVCHCDNCRRRTGAAFGWQAYFPDAQLIDLQGRFREHRIRNEQVRYFCEACGTTLYWTSVFMPGHTGVAAGAFEPPGLPAPSLEAMSRARFDWVTLPEGLVRV